MSEAAPDEHTDIEEPPAPACDALRLADGDGRFWQCDRCALAWDDGDVRPRCNRLTYARLIEAAMAEAIRIEASQNALVAKDDRKFRHQGQLQRAMELRALARLAVKAKEQREARP
jgi:hypothetical protein